MIEDKSYDVTLVLRISTVIEFAPIERDSPITKSDAIENAIWSGIAKGSYGPTIGLTIEEALEDLGFALALPIEGEAREL